MKNIKKLPLIAIILMAILSFTNVLGLSISGSVIIMGIIVFFLNSALDKKSLKENGLNISGIVANLKDKKIWIWMILPIIVDAVCVTISVLFIPEYITYETERAGSFVPIELSISSVLLFFVFALGEEIAWRAFFQKQLNKIISILPVILISSFLFTLGHYQTGNTFIVIYGLIFTFINSVLYGIIFQKTNNAWVSAIAHFIANMFEVILYVLIQ